MNHQMPINMTTRSAESQGSAIRKIDGASFDALVLAAKGRVAVEFMSYSCSHCAEIEPTLQQVAEAIRFDEAVFRVNVVTDEELAATYGIRGTPTFVMFEDGREVGRIEGPSPGLKSIMSAVTQPFEV
jgi:thioredoxin 1